MNSLIHLASIPLMSSIGSGTIEWPTLGALLAWTLLSALVGSGLGVLRAGLQGPRVAQDHAGNQPRRFEERARRRGMRRSRRVRTPVRAVSPARLPVPACPRRRARSRGRRCSARRACG